jgi:hypothetical protein
MPWRYGNASCRAIKLPRQPTDASTVVLLLQGQAWADGASVNDGQQAEHHHEHQHEIPDLALHDVLLRREVAVWCGSLGGWAATAVIEAIVEAKRGRNLDAMRGNADSCRHARRGRCRIS